MNAQPDELASATPAAPEAPRRLPFAYAKRHGVLVNQWDNGRAIVWCRPDVSAATLAEVRRYLGAPITLESIDTARFDYQLRQAYEQGASEAMDIMGDLGDDTWISRASRRPCPSRRTCSRARTTRPSSGSSTPSSPSPRMKMPRTSTSRPMNTAWWCVTASMACCARCWSRAACLRRS